MNTKKYIISNDRLKGDTLMFIFHYKTQKINYLKMLDI